MDKSPSPVNLSLHTCILCCHVQMISALKLFALGWTQRGKWSRLVLSLIFSPCRVQVWLRFSKNQEPNGWTLSGGGGSLSRSGNKQWNKKNTSLHFWLLSNDNGKKKKKLHGFGVSVRFSLLLFSVSLLLNLAAPSLCVCLFCLSLSLSLAVDVIYTLFGFLSALHVLLSLLLSPSSASCDQEASHGRGTSS